MLTRSQLRPYDTGKLRTASSTWSTTEQGLRAEAGSLDSEAAAIEAAWPDPAGRQRAADLRQTAKDLRARADEIKPQIAVLDTAAAGIDDAKSKLSTAESGITSDYSVSNEGRVVIVATGERATNTSVTGRRITLEHEFFVALDQATRADLKAATALYDCLGETPPFPPLPDTGPVNLDDASIVDQALNSAQGTEGDCFFLTSLTAIAMQDPEFIGRNVRWDAARGVYVVTLYENGILGTIKREIDVDPRMQSRGGDVLDHGVHVNGGGLNFLSIYEAAFKKTFDGSVVTHFGGVCSNAMLAITGNMADFSVARPKGFDEIRDAVAAGRPVAVNTTTGWFADESKINFEERIVPMHAYVVKGFDADGRIILQNPWGPNGGTGMDGVDYPGEVHLTQEQFRKYTMQTAIANP